MWFNFRYYSKFEWRDCGKPWKIHQKDHCQGWHPYLSFPTHDAVGMFARCWHQVLGQSAFRQITVIWFQCEDVAVNLFCSSSRVENTRQQSTHSPDLHLGYTFGWDNKYNTAEVILCIDWYWSSAVGVGCCKAHHVMAEHVGECSERHRWENERGEA